MTGTIEKVVVIGAGISGLACAYRLKQLGIRALVLEAEERPGGLISTVQRNGCLFELGPQCPRFPASVWNLVRELDLESQFVAGDPKAKRFIFRQGHLHSAPFSPGSLITTGLLGPGSKLRILTEGLRHSRAPVREESLAQFVERKFGADVLNNLVDPIVATVFFGDTEKMGMDSAFPALVDWERNHGSLVRGALQARSSKRAARNGSSHSAGTAAASGETLKVTDALPSLGSFQSGMSALPEALAANLGEQVRYGVAAASVSPSRDGNGKEESVGRITLSTGEAICSELVVMAVPAYVAARLLQGSEPQFAAHLREIEYAPASVVGAVYDRAQVAHPLDGFGFMVPRQEGLHTICTFWNSSLFAERAPEGKVVLTSFAAAADADDFFTMPEERCAQIVHAENARILGISGESMDSLVWRAARALPQYNVGHKRIVEKIESELRGVPNLSIAGNFLTGRSLGDCVDGAYRLAEGLHSRLGQENI